MTGIATLLRTVVHLRAPQVLGRARLLLMPRLAPDLRPPPALRAAPGPWVLPARREPSLLDATRLRFLGVTRELNSTGWDDPSVALLWRYNLHYFDDLNARDAAARRDWHVALVDRWLAQNPPARGTAWAPYPTSLRIVNWVKWLSGPHAPQPRAEWLHSLAVQARWLMQRLEWHLLGNHLFANAKALVHAGLYFDGDEAAQWLRTGMQILMRELPEQVLADGAQFERSPMYHALAIEDVLDLLNLCRRHALPETAALRDTLSERTGPMLRWLQAMCHADGTLARFNDCAEGIAPATAELQRMADELGCTSAPLPGESALLLQPSGYARLTRASALLLADVAPIGPDYLPGHAHADTLSYELSIAQRQLVVNRGTSEYGTGPRRQLERGTAAHSTVQLAGHDSSEMWAGFRVGRRARVRNVALQGFELRAVHDGYRFLPGAPLHRRLWKMDAGALQVEDEVSPACAGIVRHHLSPGLTLHRANDAHWTVRDGLREIARAEVLSGIASTTTWQHAQGFGALVAAHTLELELENGRAALRWHW